jgi:hypothetical protein
MNIFFGTEWRMARRAESGEFLYELEGLDRFLRVWLTYRLMAGTAPHTHGWMHNCF